MTHALARLLITLITLTALLSPGPATAQPIQVTDILGRQITLPAPAKHVVLAQARHFQLLSLLTPDPAAILAGWSDEYKTSFAPDYRLALKRFPRLAEVPIVGRHTPDSFSIETTLGLHPDLVIMAPPFAGVSPGGSPSQSPILERLQAAGVPVLVIDFFTRPMENTIPSLQALGKALGREAQAQAFIAFYRQHMQAVAQGLAGLPESGRPPVFLHAFAGAMDCCNSPGTGTFNEMIQYAGGHNIAADVLKTPTGKLNFEYVNARQPQVYIATGTGSSTRSGLAIGAGVSEAQARESLVRIIHDNRLDALPAVRSGNSHGIWHAFNDTPLHVILIEAMARWFHPNRFADLDPAQTLRTVNQRFLAVPLQGTYWVNLKATP